MEGSMIRISLAAVCIAVCTVIATAQTTINPDISVIPRFLIESNDGAALAEGKREFSRPDLTFQELEMVLSAYLNPFARGDVVLTLPGPDVEAGKLGIEELYATILRGLPGDVNLRIGKYRAEFGKLNQMHPHQWPFITQPLVAERFIGEEGLNDIGISLSALLPTGELYTRLTVDLLRGPSVGEGAGIEDTSGSPAYYAMSSRLSGFFPLSDVSDLETGVSCYTGIHDPFHRDRFWYWNLDAKFKYRPDMYTSLTLQGEVLVNRRDAQQDREYIPFTEGSVGPVVRSIRSVGGYLYGELQFEKIYSAGLRLDYAESPYHAGDQARAVAFFAGYYPVEETIGVRLEYQHKIMGSGEEAQGVNTIALQVLFSLGPHKAHPF
jgi:hypothetical protein